MNVEMIIPTLDNDESDNTLTIESAIQSMCAMYGRATVFDARGYWSNEAGRLYKDDVVVIRSASDNGKQNEALRFLARRVLQVTDQEAVFISIGGKAEIIE